MSLLGTAARARVATRVIVHARTGSEFELPKHRIRSVD